MFLDTFAWIEYFEGTAKGAKVRQRLDASDVVYTSPMVLAELTSKYTRTSGKDDAQRRVAFVLDHCVMVDHTAELGATAGALHAELKGEIAGIGMADCFVLAAARSKGARVLTGDPHFKGVPDADVL
jgi:predicted nucleic acid-binding protein